MSSTTYLDGESNSIDYTAEAIAAAIVESGVPTEQIWLRIIDAHKRPYIDDIISIEPRRFKHSNKEFVVISTPREGMTDTIPEGMIYRNYIPKKGLNAKEAVEDLVKWMEASREEEKQAKDFFAPFEAEINHLRILTALYENRLDKPSHFNDLKNIFEPHWDIFNCLTANRQMCLFTFYPSCTMCGIIFLRLKK